MESKLFHFYVHERLKSEGLAGDDLLKATDDAGEIARPLLEPTILWFHRKGLGEVSARGPRNAHGRGGRAHAGE